MKCSTALAREFGYAVRRNASESSRNVYLRSKNIWNPRRQSSFFCTRTADRSRRDRSIVRAFNRKDPGNPFSFVEVKDEGLTVVISARNFEYRVSKAELWAYLVPVAGLVVTGVLGAIFLGPFILALLLGGGLILASLSMVAATMVAVFVVPVAVMVGVAATTAAGGFVFGASAIALTVGIWVLLGSGVRLVSINSESEEKVAPKPLKSKPKKTDEEKWVEELAQREVEIKLELEEFDKQLDESRNKDTF